MKKLFLTLSCLVAAVLANAQTPTFSWAKKIGGTSVDIGGSIVVDASGNVHTGGRFTGTVDFNPGTGTSNLTSAGNTDVFISKLNASGNFVWAKKLGGTLEDGGVSVVDASGNVYTAGRFNGTADFDPGTGTYNITSAGDTDIFVTKLDDSGNFVWAKSMGGTSADAAYNLTLDASGNIYTTGYFTGTAYFGSSTLTSAGIWDIFVSKLDASGNFVWAKSMGGTSQDLGKYIAVDGSGNVYSTGFLKGTADFDPDPDPSVTYNLTSAGGSDIYISKLDASGKFIWAKRMGGTSGNEASQSFVLDASGNVYTIGGFAGTADFDPGTSAYNLTSYGSNDVFVSKLDVDGKFVWAKQLGGAYYEWGYSIALDGSGNVYTTGTFNGTADFNPGSASYNLSTSYGARDMFLSKLDASGNFVWAQNFGGRSGACEGHALTVDAYGNIYTTGLFSNTVDFDLSKNKANLNSAGGADIFVLKLSQPAGSEPFREEEATTGVRELSNSADFLLFPNPAKEQVTISCNLEHAVIAELKLIDITGKTLISELFTAKQGEINYTIDLNGVSKGLYFIEFTTEGQGRIVKKLMVE